MNTKTSTIVEAQRISRSLTIRDRTIHVLKDISFQVERSEWVALTGPSGSGKSTLLALLAGIDTVTSGSLLLDGVDLTELSENRLARIRNAKIGVVFQSFHLIPTLTAQENVEVPLYVSPRASQSRRRAAEMLERVGLGDRADHRPHQLSGGEQQRVAIARALVNEPSLLLADEPTGNLDSATGRRILHLIGELRRSMDLTVVMVTHDPAVARAADRVFNLFDGRLTRYPNDNGRAPTTCTGVHVGTRRKAVKA